MAETQNYKNHTMFDPPFHFFLVPVGLAALIWAIVGVIQHPNWMSGAHVLAIFWLVLLLFKTRIYSLKVQDRVIRLEERLRLQSVLPAAMQPRINDLSVDQLIGLRFASDAELPGLVEKTLAGNWNRKQVKEAIQNWRADNWRI
ncbi:MAG TPA: DUF6526 family protein [Bryobacteraceae bacterium]|nr:DUF6526 family protein [Bryobacteraceae bacterium]